MKIYAPVTNANGVYASVRFVNGVGETDNPRLIQWFETHGYTVESGGRSEKKDVITDESEFVEINLLADEDEMMGYSEKPTEGDMFDKMTPLELREWARANGLADKIKNTRSKEKLLEIVRG